MITKKNIGMPDRIVRIAMGIIFLSIIPLAFFGPKTPLAYFGFLGIIPLIAGISGYCPPYDLMGINTYRREKTAN
ncbi:MAG: DUF2892 domain-containing protein [Candidatus Zixiibacteriota bacterium]|nr:MAG: DUF2892 domain-containing protein [candidate division Zixibacteria bacterium]